MHTCNSTLPPPTWTHTHTHIPHPSSSHRSTDQLMVTKVFSYQRRFMGSCSLTDFSDSCPLPGDMSSQVMEHASIPQNHSLYNNLGTRRDSPGERGRREIRGGEGEGRDRGRRRRGGQEREGVAKGRKREGERGPGKRKRRGMGMRAISYIVHCTCMYCIPILHVGTCTCNTCMQMDVQYKIYDFSYPHYL